MTWVAKGLDTGGDLTKTDRIAMTSPVSCVRLYADEKGESHFEDIEFDMASIQYAPPAPALDISDPVKASQAFWFRFPDGWNDAPTLHHAGNCSCFWKAKWKAGQAWVTLGCFGLGIGCLWKTQLEKATAPDR